jgi:hypothetical protein
MMIITTVSSARGSQSLRIWCIQSVKLSSISKCSQRLMLTSRMCTVFSFWSTAMSIIVQAQSRLQEHHIARLQDRPQNSRCKPSLCVCPFVTHVRKPSHVSLIWLEKHHDLLWTGQGTFDSFILPAHAQAHMASNGITILQFRPQIRKGHLKRWGCIYCTCKRNMLA